MDGYFRFYEKPELIFPNEIEEQTTTKIAFHDSRKFIDSQSGYNENWSRLVRDLTNVYGRAIYAYENEVSQPFDNHEETLYRLSNWYVR